METLESTEPLELTEEELGQLMVEDAQESSEVAEAKVVQEGISYPELIQLAAADTQFFNTTFFPRAFRQPSAPFHGDMIEKLDNPLNRYIDFMCFRGSAKTTLLRAFTAKRIAYNVSRTILYVSASQGHSMKSIDWIRKQVEFNTFFAQMFHLRRGKVWNAEMIEIIHGVEGNSIWVIAVGITGQTRGLNLDDFRPDLIVVDDPCDEENTNTPEQRVKTANLFFGSIQNSLAPVSECPDAKLVLAQTVLNEEDLVSTCHKDEQWVSARYSCFDENGQSSWPDRWSTETLLAEKAGYIRRNQLSLWMREMESKIVSAELCDFRENWLEYYDVLPEGMVTYMAIDPASSEAKTADDQVIGVVGFHKGNCYLLEYKAAKGQNPEDTAADFFRMKRKWRPLSCSVESVSYQRVLAWYLRKEMQRRNEYLPIIEFQDRRKKRDRIRQALAGRASEGRFFVRADMVEFIQQFVNYPNVNHDDILDMVSIAIDGATPELVDPSMDSDLNLYGEGNVVNMKNWRHAP